MLLGIIIAIITGRYAERSGRTFIIWALLTVATVGVAAVVLVVSPGPAGTAAPVSQKKLLAVVGAVALCIVAGGIGLALYQDLRAAPFRDETSSYLSAARDAITHYLLSLRDDGLDLPPGDAGTNLL